MISIDRFTEILEELANELPQEFYNELNLGINIVTGAKIHPAARQNDLYIMGEYFRNAMGRGISIFYGSFERVFGNLSEEALTQELRKTLRHEFRHHMEGRSGERGLEVDDERRIRDYMDK